MRLATALAGGLATAAAVMAVLAFTTGGDGDERPAAAPSATSAAPSPGLAVFVAQGCGSCHTLAAANARGEIGPDLASSLQGMPASYIRKSIVAPSAHAAPGFSTGIMPEDYASRMTPADLDALVRFLRASARGAGG